MQRRACLRGGRYPASIARASSCSIDSTCVSSLPSASSITARSWGESADISVSCRLEAIRMIFWYSGLPSADKEISTARPSVGEGSRLTRPCLMR